MPVQRMRMRSWLEERIDSQTVAGLEWVSKEDKMFSIPWKHAARHGWEVDKDACLFKQWAIHTGKFKEGQTADPKTWKANFRCAMNSLPDIEEVKNRSVNKGCAAMRVYRMLPLQPKRKNKRVRSRDTRRSSSSKASWQSSEEQMMQENKVDSTRDDNSPYTHVPDVAGFDVEIGPDNTHSFTNRFQVSPVHSTDLEENEDEIIIELTRQLERDTMQWQPNNVFGKGFLSNEGSTSVSLSPDSQWSTSSGDELELRLYTELNSDPVDDLFNGNTWTTSTSLMPL